MSEPYLRSSSTTKVHRTRRGSILMNGNESGSGTAKRTFSDTSSLVGSKNPNWRRQVKRGLQAGTPLSASKVRYTVGPHNAEEWYLYTGAYKLTHKKLDYHEGSSFQAFPYYNPTGSSQVTEADNQAKTNYISNAEKARQILQSGEMIGEFSELVRQVSSPAKSLRHGLGEYVQTVKKRLGARRRNGTLRRNSRDQAKMLSDTWLEYSFGWRPLIGGISDVYDYVAETDPFSRHDTRKIQGVGKAEGAAWISSTKSQKTISIPGFSSRTRGFTRVVVIYRGHVSMSSTAGGYVTEKVGFAPSQWLPTAWELIPYSFLLDYFANIGSMISALSFPVSALDWTVKSVIIENEGKFVDTKAIWKYGDGIQGSAPYQFISDKRLWRLGGASTFVKTVQRDPYYGSFIPTLEFSIPGSGTKWLNLAALFLGARQVQKLLS